MPETLVKLKRLTHCLNLLLDEPEPGLLTWNRAVLSVWKSISDLYVTPCEPLPVGRNTLHEADQLTEAKS